MQLEKITPEMFTLAEKVPLGTKLIRTHKQKKHGEVNPGEDTVLSARLYIDDPTGAELFPGDLLGTDEGGRKVRFGK